MIPEPNLWADLRDRDRDLDEVEYPPHHMEAPTTTTSVSSERNPLGSGPGVGPHHGVNNRTLPRNSCQDHHGHFLKEELELEPGGNGSAAVTVSSAASMNNVNEAEVMRQRQRWTRRWYLLVIVLLYIGLLASFSLNVSLLLRKPSTVTRTLPSEGTVSEAGGRNGIAAGGTAASIFTGDGTEITDSQGRTTRQSPFFDVDLYRCWFCKRSKKRDKLIYAHANIYRTSESLFQTIRQGFLTASNTQRS